MYCFAKICCLCLQHNPELLKLDEMDQHGLTFFEKLLMLIPDFGELVKKSIPNYLCKKCKRYVNKFYKFQQNCLKSYKLLESYVKQLDTNNEELENNVIEDDLILIKEDMEECLKNMEIYIKVEDGENEITSSRETNEQREDTSPPVNGTSEDTTTAQNVKKRTRELPKKISYNEDYDSDSMFSDSEVYLTNRAKRKRTKTRKEMDNAQKKQDKTVVIPQNDIFAKDLTRTINGIITRLSAAGDASTTTQPEEVKVKFKNSSGNTEQLSICRNEDTVEIRFTKEEKMGYLRICRQGDSIILTHNMSESSDLQDLVNLRDVEAVKEDSPKRHVDEYMNLGEMSCKICDKMFEDVAELRRHIQVHAPSTPSTLSTSVSTATPSPCSTEDLNFKEAVETSPLTNGDIVKAELVTSPRASQCREMKVLLPALQENVIKSERSSSPEYQFHLSDESDDDDFDNDTLILDTLDNGDDFEDVRSPSPVQLGLQVLKFLEETDTPFSSVRIPEETPTPICLKSPQPEVPEAPEIPTVAEVKETPNGNNDSSFEEKLLKIVVNKMDVDEFMKKMEKTKIAARKPPKRCSPRRHTNGCTMPEDKSKVCAHCKEAFKTQRKFKRHLQRVHGMFAQNLKA